MMGRDDVSEGLKGMIDAIAALSVAFGIEFADSSGLEDMQLGYGVDVTGKDLSGTGPGEWRASWLVFGYDYGDPVFVDTKEAARGFPVYVAEHGMESWEPQEIGRTLADFSKILVALQAAMTAGAVDYRRLMAAIEPHTQNMDYWDVVIEGIEDHLA